MEKVRIYHDKQGRTLSVWFGDPAAEHVCEEVADDVVLVKNLRGRVIGFEQLNYQPDNHGEDAGVAVEVQSN